MVRSWSECLAKLPTLNKLLGSSVTIGECCEIDKRSSPWHQESDFRGKCQATKYGGGTHVQCRRPSSLSWEGKYIQTSSARLSQTFLCLQGKSKRLKQLTTLVGTLSRQGGGGPKHGLLGFPRQDVFLLWYGRKMNKLWSQRELTPVIP